MPARKNALRNLIVPGQEKIGFPSARKGGRERVSRLFFTGHPSGGYMMSSCSCTPNKSIKCSVTQCAHHCKDDNYCALSSIQVGTHEANPTEVKCTDCESFTL